jgi:hypothetical protein
MESLTPRPELENTRKSIRDQLGMEDLNSSIPQRIWRADRPPLRSSHAREAAFWIRSSTSHPSQPVRSLLFDFRLRENYRHSRGLCWRARVSGWQIPDFWLWTQWLCGAPLAIFQFPFRHTRDRFDM